ncbi:MAG TPA: carboxylesterase family protein [Acidimicrobiales bacterium]|nr:carboxylesterase family protein [Acidimicrobiales bacterium]
MQGVVSVSQGRLKGVWRGDHWSFSGIPYARPPLGELRWRAPQPAPKWAEIRDASAFGPIAPQSAGTAGVISPADPAASEEQSEDCLSLNVWTRVLPDEPAVAGGRPVMVYIHGGGFTSGSGSVFLYRGGDLVRNGNVVVVTINYRLGALGFLAHRALAGPDGSAGNWGLHDQVAALRWVRDNIAVFGGDPANVTVFGESAGAFSIAALLGAPASTGLFRRAVLQSGAPHVHTLEEAERATERLATVLELPSCERGSFERVPASELVAATEELGRRRPDPGALPLPFLPVVDGNFLPRHPLDAVAGGSGAGVDLLVGTNRDELTLYGLGNPELLALDEDGVTRWVQHVLPGVPPRGVVEAYRLARQARSEPVGPSDVWVAAGSDIVFRWPSLQLAAAHGATGARAYVYLFEWESPAFGGILGSCHALELPFVFGAVERPVVQMFAGSGPEVERLSAEMQRAWLSFAAAGDPAHEGIGPWRPWDPVTRTTMIFGGHTRSVDAPRNEELGVLEEHRPLVIRHPQ